MNHTIVNCREKRMIFRYPDNNCYWFILTGITLSLIGYILLIVFNLKYNTILFTILRFISLFMGLIIIFLIGLPFLIRGIRQKLIYYEIDYRGLTIVYIYPRNTRLIIRWKNCRILKESGDSIKLTSPRGVELIYKSIENFEEMNELIKKYTNMYKKNQEDVKKSREPRKPFSKL